MASVKTVVSAGAGGFLVDVECHTSNGLPAIVIVGLGGKSVAESKERIRAAFSSANIGLPRKRITINLAPADIAKDSSSLDLAIASAILANNSQTPRKIDSNHVVIGELGLEGKVKPVRGIIGKILTAKRLGIHTFFIPHANAEQARLIPDIVIVPINTISQLHEHLNGGAELLSQLGSGGQIAQIKHVSGTPLSAVVGQESAKRAVCTAAAGGHNLFLYGQPGSGKSMLAHALLDLLPPMTYDEILEATHIQSLTSTDYESLITSRPFRAPHHSTSRIALVGGGGAALPGEISLSHRGILFLDEIPEFERGALEALRQPLEERQITITRLKHSFIYPANFILVAAANPCPCGYYGSSHECICTAFQIAQYKQKLSGPLLDRIDMHVHVSAVNHADLLAQQNVANYQEQLRAKIRQAREIQYARLGDGRLNADMNNDEIKQHARLEKNAHKLLNEAANSLGLSARSYMRTVRVARTIADIEQSSFTNLSHIAEAIQYRNTIKA